MGGRRRPRSSADGGPSRAPKRQKRLREADADLAVASDADYFVSGNLRYVVPYVFQYRMSCKARWRGRRVLDVFNAELSKQNQPTYWRDEFLGRRVVLNGKPVESDDVWRHNDLVLHSVHRHESPVLNLDIAIVHSDDKFLVVDKPASIPVHPCGTYRKASLIYLLAAAGWTDLRLVHRLDKQTSGIVVFGRTREAANEFVQALSSRSLRKRYLARVRGRFPEGVTVACREPLSIDERAMRTGVDRNGGKDAETLFRAVAYDSASNQSLIACEPLTGRSHQIRVHLEHIGFSIANDPLYDPVTSAATAAKGSATPARGALRLSGAEDIDASGVVLEEGVGLSCSNCPFVANSLNVDHESGMLIYLHALEYEGDDWLYTTKLPFWTGAFSGSDVEKSLQELQPLKNSSAIEIDAARFSQKHSWLRHPSLCTIT